MAGIPMEWDSSRGGTGIGRITGGDETIPTVLFEGTELVDPSAAAVLELVQARPTRPDTRGPADPWTVGKVVQWVVIGGVIVASFTVDGFGHHALSWGLDGVGLLAYLGFRLVRR